MFLLVSGWFIVTIMWFLSEIHRFETFGITIVVRTKKAEYPLTLYRTFIGEKPKCKQVMGS